HRRRPGNGRLTVVPMPAADERARPHDGTSARRAEILHCGRTRGFVRRRACSGARSSGAAAGTAARVGGPPAPPGRRPRLAEGPAPPGHTTPLPPARPLPANRGRPLRRRSAARSGCSTAWLSGSVRAGAVAGRVHRPTLRDRRVDQSALATSVAVTHLG